MIDSILEIKNSFVVDHFNNWEWFALLVNKNEVLKQLSRMDINMNLDKIFQSIQGKVSEDEKRQFNNILELYEIKSIVMN
jgi:hypothetical protein